MSFGIAVLLCRLTDSRPNFRRVVSNINIDVYHAEQGDMGKTQRIVIHYNCINAFEVPDRRKIPEADITMKTRKGVAVSYPPVQIAV